MQNLDYERHIESLHPRQAGEAMEVVEVYAQKIQAMGTVLPSTLVSLHIDHDHLLEGKVETAAAAADVDTSQIAIKRYFSVGSTVEMARIETAKKYGAVC